MNQRDQIADADWEGRFAAIEKEAAAILATEGTHHVRGVFYVLESDAEMARMVEAERRVADRDSSMDRYIERRRSEPPVVIDLMEALKKSMRESAAPARCPEMSVAGTDEEAI